MDDGHLIAVYAELRDVFAGFPHHAELGLGGGPAVLGLEGIAPQGDD